MSAVLTRLKLNSQYNFQMELWHHVLPMMIRGVLIDKEQRAQLALELMNELMLREHNITTICGHPLNPSSPKQMKALFYDDLGAPKQYSRKNKNTDGSRKLTLDEEALENISRKEPLLRELIRNIVEYRSVGVFLSTFVQARLGPDGRMRCYFNPAGTETYRFSSSEDAFGSGTNLQNLPRGLEDDAIEASELKQIALPNIRKLFKPDPGYTIGEADLAGADAQVVAWEANAPKLKQIFREGKKVHVENGRMMYGEAFMGPSGKREPYYTRVKVGGHATNYGALARTVAGALSISVHEADRFQKRWFEIHPEILEWHKRINSQISTTRMVSNKFGYRRFYWDRISELLPEALAWVPQSTVALVANQGLVNTHRHYTYQDPLQAWVAENTRYKTIYDPEYLLLRERLEALGFQMLLQVHDSIVFQYPTRAEAEVLSALRRALTVTIPYDDPLIIPWGLKTSTINWGVAEERKWPAEVVAK
jgi:DNA polymerase I-like protein with 3'-5' exonuclease and polymerase domains